MPAAPAAEVAVAVVAETVPTVAAPVAVAKSEAPAAPAQPVVSAEPFVLAMTELQAVAQQAGLEWVNSDAAKVQAIRDAIANEPKPAHVPRERKPTVLSDEGPLVLVETRKDLSQVKLPFETAA